MGRCHAFLCTKCGYSARVSGGEDSGRFCCTQTIHCLDCNDLYDVVTHARQRRTLGLERQCRTPAALRSLWSGTPLPAHAHCSGQVLRTGARPAGEPWPATRLAPWVIFKITCPKGAHHRVKRWKHPGRCPRCNTHMEKALVPYRLWE